MHANLTKRYNKILAGFRYSVSNQEVMRIINADGDTIEVKAVARIKKDGHFLAFIEGYDGRRYDILNLRSFEFASRD